MKGASARKRDLKTAEEKIDKVKQRQGRQIEVSIQLTQMGWKEKEDKRPSAFSFVIDIWKSASLDSYWKQTLTLIPKLGWLFYMF